MRRGWMSIFMLCALAWTQTAAAGQKATEASGVAGRWLVTVDYHGTTIYYWLKLTQQGDKLAGDFDGDKLEGTASGSTVHFLAKDDQGGDTEEGQRTVQGASMSGTVIFVAGNNPDHPDKFSFTAQLALPRKATTPKRHEFVPTTFYRQFSPFNKPVLTVAPGDTIHTTTVDAGGLDEKGVSRVLG